MSAPSGNFSAFLPQNDAMEEQHKFGTPIASIDPFLSTEVYETSRAYVDDPFSIINPDYICVSPPSVLNLNINQSNSSQVLQEKKIDDDNCDTTSFRSGYNLARSWDPSLPRGKHWKKTGAKGGNNIHKFVERQRRNDMKILYSKLISLLPHENVKGKRSLSDQIEEAINYIHQLEKKVKNPGQKREDVKISDHPKMSSYHDMHRRKLKKCEGMPYRASKGFPKVMVEYLGPVVQITVNVLKNQIVFSNLLLALEEGGLEIVAAVSSTINDKVFHTIQSKVPDLRQFQCASLCEKVWQMMGEGSQDTQGPVNLSM